MTSSTHPSPVRTRTASAATWVGWLWLGALAVAYAMLVASPLRLNQDAAAYLMLSWPHEGAGATATRSYPPGYPALLEMARMAGAWMPAAIVALNGAALFAGALAARVLFEAGYGMSRLASRWGVAVVLSSFVVVKNAPLPMPDVIAAAGAWIVLAALLQMPEHRGRAWTLLLGVAAGIALLAALRTVSLLLAVPLALVVWDRLSAEGHRAKTAVVVAATIVGGAWWLQDSIAGYAVEWVENYSLNGFGSVLWNAEQKTRGFAELVSNVPYRVTARWGLEGAWILVGTGLLVGGALLAWRTRRAAPALYAFALVYLAVLLAWPSRGERFWLPVLPLVVGYGYTALRAWKAPRWTVGVLLGWFFLTGFVAHAYGLWQMLPSDRFPERYGRGAYEKPFDAFCSGTSVEPGDDLQSHTQYRVWLVLREDQRPLVPALSPCPDGPPLSYPPEPAPTP